MIKLALTDLDDTLIPMGSKHASARACAAMRKMIDAGLHVGPVSGRMPSAMSWMFPNEPKCYATGAFCNGQMIYIDSQLIYRKELPADALRKVRDILDELGTAVLLVYEVDDENGWMTHISKKPQQLLSNELLHTLVKTEADIRPDLPHEHPVKANVFCPFERDVQTNLRDMLNREVPELQFVFPSNHVPIIDVLPKDWGKDAAVLKMAEILGIDRAEVVVFGDSENDLAMMQAVPNSIAVANACKEVKAAARWHIGAAVDESVPAALEEIADCAVSAQLPSFLRDV